VRKEAEVGVLEQLVLLEQQWAELVEMEFISSAGLVYLQVFHLYLAVLLQE
jgi:hypothetical protein